MSNTLKRLAANIRYSHETRGHEVNGVRYLTDRASRGIMADAQELAEATGEAIRWKAASGRVTLTAEEMKAVRLQLGIFIAGLFAAEERIGALIDAGQITTPEEVARWSDWTN